MFDLTSAYQDRGKGIRTWRNNKLIIGSAKANVETKFWCLLVWIPRVRIPVPSVREGFPVGLSLIAGSSISNPYVRGTFVCSIDCSWIFLFPEGEL